MNTRLYSTPPDNSTIRHCSGSGGSGDGGGGGGSGGSSVRLRCVP